MLRLFVLRGGGRRQAALDTAPLLCWPWVMTSSGRFLGGYSPDRSVWR